MTELRAQLIIFLSTHHASSRFIGASLVTAVFCLPFFTHHHFFAPCVIFYQKSKTDFQRHKYSALKIFFNADKCAYAAPFHPFWVSSSILLLAANLPPPPLADNLTHPVGQHPPAPPLLAVSLIHPLPRLWLFKGKETRVGGRDGFVEPNPRGEAPSR